MTGANRKNKILELLMMTLSAATHGRGEQYHPSHSPRKICHKNETLGQLAVIPPTVIHRRRERRHLSYSPHRAHCKTEILELFMMIPSTAIHRRGERCHPSYNPRRINWRNPRAPLTTASTSDSRVVLLNSSNASRKNLASWVAGGNPSPVVATRLSL